MNHTPTREQIERLRSEIGTQAEVSERLGIGKRTLERAENDERYPRRALIYYALRGLVSKGEESIV